MREKVLSLSEAAGWVQNGSLLGFTCQFLENAPMAFLREVVRRKTRDLRVATLPGGGLRMSIF
jgi:acyl CoA:acetate/3-ketoacid CoA transferase alpha subunit